MFPVMSFHVTIHAQERALVQLRLCNCLPVVPVHRRRRKVFGAFMMEGQGCMTLVVSAILAPTTFVGDSFLFVPPSSQIRMVRGLTGDPTVLSLPSRQCLSATQAFHPAYSIPLTVM